MRLTYDRQAQAFLDRFNLTIHADKDDKVCPPWCEGDHLHGDHYVVSIIDKSEKREPFIFDFWNSYKDKENGDPPTEYQVLAALAIQIDAKPFGESQEILKYLQILTNKSLAFFTEYELNALQEIQ
jgi:hypothetical protein